MASILKSREGVMQRNPLSMFAYDIGSITLIKQPKAYNYATQTWYSDNVGAIGTFGNIELYFNFLKYSGPVCG